MKSDLVKVSLALLSAVFILGCQDVGSGPVGPDGPQFNKPVEVTPENKTACEATLGFFFDEKGHCHDGEEPVVRPMFDVDVTSESGHVSFSGVTDPKRGEAIIVDEDDLTLAFFTGAELKCSLAAVTPTASLWISPGEDHVHLFFQFEYKNAGYTLELLGNRGNWPPAVDKTVKLTHRNGGEWSVSSKGKNNKDACTGSGFGIVWEATVVNPVN